MALERVRRRAIVCSAAHTEPLRPVPAAPLAAATHVRMREARARAQKRACSTLAHARMHARTPAVPVPFTARLLRRRHCPTRAPLEKAGDQIAGGSTDAHDRRKLELHPRRHTHTRKQTSDVANEQKAAPAAAGTAAVSYTRTASDRQGGAERSLDYGGRCSGSICDGPSPGADVGGRAQSQRRCGRGKPSPGADVGGASPPWLQ